MTQAAFLETALAALHAGISLIPINPDTKRPYGKLLPDELDETGKPKKTWKPYQERRATEDEVRAWYAAGAQFAAVGGRISGGLECIDHDNIGGRLLFDAWRAAVDDLADGLTTQQTGGGGYQVAYRYAVPEETTRDGNQKLAWLADDTQDTGRSVAIETRGEGGYFVVAPSLHPSGNRYELLCGSWDTIPTISYAHRNALLDAARRLDEMPHTRQEQERQREQVARPKATTYRASLNGEISVIDAYNVKVAIADELRQHGYQDAGRGRLIRPNAAADSQAGVVLGGGEHINMSFHHSSNDLLCDGYWHAPFDVRCSYDFNDDINAAVRAVAVELGVDHLSNIPEPPRDAEGWACCPNCAQRLRAAKNGNGYRCLKDGGVLCFWWQGDGYTPPGEIAGDPAAADDARPAIDISTIDLLTLMPLAWDAIAVQNDPPALFRRAGELARLETTESGALVVKTVDTRVMLGILARAARWVRVTYARGGARVEKEALPPAAVVDDAMVNIDPRIPPITRVVHAPAFANGETLLTTPGYHADARIYYDPKPGAVVQDVPEQPTTAELARARSLVLDHLLVDFPFVSEADRAHAIALFLLPFVRDLIDGPTPLHLIEAPTMGSGKGLLADALLLPALGDVPAPMAEASTDEEWRKRITSTLLGAPAVIYIDNLNRMLAAGALAAALTAREFSDRVLGKSEQVALPVRCVWAATANNPTLSTEIARRCIRIRIDPKDDRPWQREGFKHPKLRSWVQEHRGDLIWAALVICRYGLQHGAVGRPLGSYEAWSDVLGRILDGAGFPGFLGNLDALYDRADAEGAAWRALIGAWWEKHQDKAQPASELYALVAETEADVLISGKDEIGRKKSFGKALARAQDRVFSVEIADKPQRLQVGDGGSKQRARLWKLVPVDRVSIVSIVSFSPSHARDNNFSSTEHEENSQNTQNSPAQPTRQDKAQAHQARRALADGDAGLARGYADGIRNAVLRATVEGEIDQVAAVLVSGESLPEDYEEL